MHRSETFVVKIESFVPHHKIKRQVHKTQNGVLLYNTKFLRKKTFATILLAFTEKYFLLVSKTQFAGKDSRVRNKQRKQ